MINKYQKKFNRILSDPFNSLIPRNVDAGSVDGDGCIVMNSGVRVLPRSYCQEFTDIFLTNRGVHEPSQEYIFGLILDKIKQSGVVNPVMVEFGSYWAYYSMWFQKVVGGVNYCVEPNIHHLEIGKKHFELNNMTGTFIKSRIGLWPNDNRNITIDKMVNTYNLSSISLIHADIQKAEVDLLRGGIDSFNKKLIDYVFISTHSDSIHDECLLLLKDYGYRVIAEGKEHETYFGDGLIVACKDSIDFEYIELRV